MNDAVVLLVLAACENDRLRPLEPAALPPPDPCAGEPKIQCAGAAACALGAKPTAL